MTDNLRDTDQPKSVTGRRDCLQILKSRVDKFCRIPLSLKVEPIRSKDCKNLGIERENLSEVIRLANVKLGRSFILQSLILATSGCSVSLLL